MYKTPKNIRDYANNRYHELASAHKCVVCGKELTDWKTRKCNSCAKKHLIKVFRSKVRNGSRIDSWLPTEYDIYPDDDTDGVLVTFVDGEVAYIEKRKTETWLELFDGVIAWRSLPKAYEVKTDD